MTTPSLLSDLNIITLLYFLFFNVTIVMGTYVYIMNQGNAIARVFLALAIVFSIIHLGEGLMSWTTVAADARALYVFKAFGFVPWWPIGTLLFLTLRNEPVSRGYRIALGVCFAYAAVLLAATFFGVCRPGDDLAKIGWTWIDTPYWHPLAVPYLAMMPLCLGLDIVQIFVIRRRAVLAANIKTVRQMDMIAVAGIFAFVGGNSFNVIAPMLGIVVPAVGHLFLGFWILVLGYAIVRYRLFVPTIEYASRQVFHLAGEMIVLTDNHYNITDSNASFVRRIGSIAAKRRLCDLLLDQSEPINNLDPDARDRILELLTIEGPPVYVKINGSPLMDKYERVGYVFVLSDISELKERNSVLESRVRERTQELIEEKTEAERRLKVTEIYTRKSIVEVISQGLDPTQFKPEARDLAVLFADIRDFTTIAENLSPLETVELLNRYFDAMNATILNHSGEIDKLIGDCIMALYKTPDEAVASAVMMRKVLHTFNEGHALRKRVNNGIGINYGALVSGNIGSSDKMDYTVIGDTVNTSSRLEALTKYYRLPILVSEEVRQRLTGDFAVRFVDTVLVKGKRAPLTLYEVFDHEADAIKELKLAKAGLYADLYDLYKRGRFNEALDGYVDLRSRLGEHTYQAGVCKDPVVDLYIDRCLSLLERQQAGALADWTGVFEFAEK